MVKKDFRDVAVAVLALGTAYGLGILSCVVYEVKLLAEYYTATKDERKCKPITYRDYYARKHKTEE